MFRWRDLWVGRIPELRLLYSHQNGERMTVGQAHQARLGGMPKGIPDLHWPVPRGGHHGLFIEMKRLTGAGLSADQRWWADHLRAQGNFVVMARGGDRAIHWILRYHAGTGLQLGDRDWEGVSEDVGQAG